MNVIFYKIYSAYRTSGQGFYWEFLCFLEKFFSKIGQVSYMKILSPTCWGSLPNGGRCVPYMGMGWGRYQRSKCKLQNYRVKLKNEQDGAGGGGKKTERLLAILLPTSRDRDRDLRHISLIALIRKGIDAKNKKRWIRSLRGDDPGAPG